MDATQRALAVAPGVEPAPAPRNRRDVVALAGALCDVEVAVGEVADDPAQLRPPGRADQPRELEPGQRAGLVLEVACADRRVQRADGVTPAGTGSVGAGVGSGVTEGTVEGTGSATPDRLCSPRSMVILLRLGVSDGGAVDGAASAQEPRRRRRPRSPCRGEAGRSPPRAHPGIHRVSACAGRSRAAVRVPAPGVPAQRRCRVSRRLRSESWSIHPQQSSCSVPEDRSGLRRFPSDEGGSSPGAPCGRVAGSRRGEPGTHLPPMAGPRTRERVTS